MKLLSPLCDSIFARHWGIQNEQDMVFVLISLSHSFLINKIVLWYLTLKVFFVCEF